MSESGLGSFGLTIRVQDAELKQLQRELLNTEAAAVRTGRAIAAALGRGGADGGREFGDGFDREGTSRTRDSAAKMARTAADGFDAAGRKAGSSFGDAFGGSLKNVMGGILQGIGQQITQMTANVAGNALKSLGNREAFNNMDGAKAGLQSLGADTEKLEKLAQGASKELKGLASSRELLQSSYNVVSSGFQGEDAIKIVSSAKKASVSSPDGTGKAADTEVVADGMTSVMNSYKVGADQADKVAAQMIGTVNAGKITMQQYASMIGQVASTAAEAGVPLEELNSVIAASTVAGVPVHSSMSGIRAAISAILKPSSDAAETAKAMGVQFNAAALQSKGLVGMLKEIKAAGLGTSEGMIKIFGSVEAVAALSPVMSKLDEGFQDIQNTVTGVDLGKAFEGGAKSVASMMMKMAALKEELELKGQTAIAPLFEAGGLALSTLLTSMNEGGVLFTSLNQAAMQFRDYLAQNPQILQSMVTAFQQLAQSGIESLSQGLMAMTNALRENPQLIQQMVQGFSEGVIFVIQFAQGMTSAVQSIIQFVTPMAEFVGSLTKSGTDSASLATNLGQAVVYMVAFGAATSIIGTVISTVTGVVSVISTISTLIAGIPAAIATVSSAWAGFQTLVMVLPESLAAIGLNIPVIGLAIAAVGITIKNVIDYTAEWDNVVLGIQQTWTDCTTWISEAVNWVVQGIQRSSIFQSVWGVISGIINAIIAPYKAIFDIVIGLLQKSEVFQGIWKGLVSITTAIGDAFKNVIGGALDGLVNKAKELFGWMQGMANMKGGGSSGGQLSAGDASVASSVRLTAAISKQSGITNEFAHAALAGTIQQESNFDPDAKEGGGTQNGRGLVQWDVRDRAKGIVKMDANGTPQGNQYHEQLRAGIEEMTRDYKEATKGRDFKADLNGAKSTREAMAIFQKTIRFGDNGDRDSHADNALKVLQSNAGVAPKESGGSGSFSGGGNHDVIPTGTLAAQEYGASRDGGAREHAGQDLDIGDNDRFQSYIGGTVTQVGNDPGGYFQWLDIFNEKLQRVERVAELDNVNVNVGDRVAPGQVVGSGTQATGVVHYEIRTDADSSGKGGFGKSGSVDPVQYLESLGLVKRQGTQLIPQAGGSNAGASIKDDHAGPNNTLVTGPRSASTIALPDKDAEAEKKKENDAMLKAVAAARSGEDKAITTKREEAKRKRTQDREEAKLKSQTSLATLTTPEAKEAVDRRMKESDITGQYDDRLLDMQQKRADLSLARDRKVKDQKSPDKDTVAKAKAAPDYTAQMKAYDALIKKEETLRDLALGNAGLSNKTADAEQARLSKIAGLATAAEQSHQVQRTTLEEQQKIASRTNPIQALALDYEIRRLDLTYAQNKALTEQATKQERLAMSLKEMKDSGVAIDSTDYKRVQTELDTVEGTIARLKQTGEIKLKMSLEDETNAKTELDFKQKDSVMSKENLFSKGANDAKSATATQMKAMGNTEGATVLEREVRLSQEALRYRQELLNIDKQVYELRKQGQVVTEQEVLGLQQQAGVVNEMNIKGITEQTKGLKGILADTAKTGFGQFFKDLITGSKSAGDAFKSFAESMLAKMADMAMNMMMSNLFGGGGGGGKGGGGIGGLISGIFGGGGGGGGLMGAVTSGGGTLGTSGPLGGLLGGLFGAADGTLPNFARGNGTAIDAAFSKERSQSGGLSPKLVVVNDRELILSAKQSERFTALGLGPMVSNFADGNLGSSVAPRAGLSSGDVNVPINITGDSGGNTPNVNPRKLQGEIKALIQQHINEQKRQGNSLSMA